MEISASLDLATRLVHGLRPLWISAGRLEGKLFTRKLEKIEIKAPVFITGLPRAGSTVILEYLNEHKGAATHQYRDLPFIFTPLASRFFTGLISGVEVRKERIHKDGILVSSRSPEGMEEMLWCAFRHHGERFATFYREHIRKMLLCSHASRYVAKNHALSMRLARVLEIFPDARIIMAVRDPVAQIGSLMRQHAHFCSLEPRGRIRRHMKALGNFTFGPARRWQQSDELGGWIDEWSKTYGELSHFIGHPNVLFVRYEDLCDSPRYWLYKISSHAKLEISEDLQEVFSKSIQRPVYYKHGLTEAQIGRIHEATGAIMSKFDVKQ